MQVSADFMASMDFSKVVDHRLNDLQDQLRITGFAGLTSSDRSKTLIHMFKDVYAGIAVDGSDLHESCYLDEIAEKAGFRRDLFTKCPPPPSETDDHLRRYWSSTMSLLEYIHYVLNEVDIPFSDPRHTPYFMMEKIFLLPGLK